MINNIFPNKNTKIYISISQNPGNSGSLFHNTSYKILEMNCIYLPLRINKIDKLFDILNKFNVRGCSVSMPFKEQVISYLDKFDMDVKKTNSSNTIVVKNNKFYGKNTDVYGANKILLKLNKMNYNTVLLVGGGGVARSIFYALTKQNYKKIFVTSRNLDRFKNWPLSKKVEIANWKNIKNIKADLLINATPLGMINNIRYKNKSIIKNDYVKNFKSVFDVVVSNSPTMLVNQFKKNNKTVFTGLEMSFYQASKQFEHYTGKKPPIKKIKKLLNYNFT